jgi:hypothetical protein
MFFVIAGRLISPDAVMAADTGVAKKRMEIKTGKYG